jgi:hypothetical protein
MKFLSQEELLRIARSTAYPLPLQVRSMVLRAVLTIPTQEAYAPPREEGRVFEVVSVFATLLVRMKPFSTSNREIAYRGIDHLLTKNEYTLDASRPACEKALTGVASGEQSSSDFVRWLEVHCTPTPTSSPSVMRIRSKLRRDE